MSNRSDIRSDISDGSIQQGIPLHLIIHIYQVNNTAQKGLNNTNKQICNPLSGARVDIWYANPQGKYSSIQHDGTGGKTFLRGYQITDKNGTVNFDIIYPVWYEGRAIHLHIKVTAFDGQREKLDWTSQFYLDDSINDKVHTQQPYSTWSYTHNK